MCQEVGIASIVSDPRVCRDISPMCFHKETITTLEGSDSVPKPDGSCNLLLHTALIDKEVRDRRFPPLDNGVRNVHVDKDICDLVQTEPECLPFGDRHPISRIPWNDIGVLVVEASVHIF
jgi:hypothetical protein